MQSRIVAFNIIYINLFEENRSAEAFDFLCSQENLRQKDIDFSNQILDAYFENKNSIHDIVESAVVGYEIKRIYKIDLALIYLATAEFLYLKTPKAVVINEVLEVAKKYSTEKSNSFINGVLAKIN
ncbi:MAG: transcription antitermination factor NusB [Clostridia bacterium]|nr:transcription antitermination factor NusB [Clostridia bacterium]MDD4685708.1 transcription antitermination factor NusB [Clostridia bacterium]